MSCLNRYFNMQEAVIGNFNEFDLIPLSQANNMAWLHCYNLAVWIGHHDVYWYQPQGPSQRDCSWFYGKPQTSMWNWTFPWDLHQGARWTCGPHKVRNTPGLKDSGLCQMTCSSWPAVGCVFKNACVFVDITTELTGLMILRGTILPPTHSRGELRIFPSRTTTEM